MLKYKLLGPAQTKDTSVNKEERKMKKQDLRQLRQKPLNFACLGLYAKMTKNAKNHDIAIAH